jgi:molybdate transport system substrate-binding protein
MHNAFQFLFTFILAQVIFSSCSKSGEGHLTVAVSANARYAIEEICDTLEVQGLNIEIVIGSSGKLASQIIEGAPFDVFISADMNYPKAVAQAGKALTSPMAYARGRLVLWSCRENVSPDPTFSNLEELEHVAIPNTELAPYGRAARAYLKDIEMWDSVYPKLVYGESVAQTNQFIFAEAVDVGFTAMSVVKAPDNIGIGSWVELPLDSYPPVIQGLVIVDREGRSSLAAQSFVDYVLSENGLEILNKYGYDKP